MDPTLLDAMKALAGIVAGVAGVLGHQKYRASRNGNGHANGNGHGNGLDRGWKESVDRHIERAGPLQDQVITLQANVGHLTKLVDKIDERTAETHAVVMAMEARSERRRRKRPAEGE